jgi:perosamine synthetase
MYRNNDLTAAFGRSQLTKLDGYLSLLKQNAQLLAELLRGTPGLILPTEPEGCTHNWYNYTMRFDMNAIAEIVGKSEVSGSKKSDFRFAILKAMQAEGVQTSVWQSYILPAMTVFQAKNGFGGGHPWTSPHAQPVDYSLHQYPVAQKHCDTHTGMTMPLRAPNAEQAVRLTAEGIRKVMENVAEVL